MLPANVNFHVGRVDVSMTGEKDLVRENRRRRGRNIFEGRYQASGRLIMHLFHGRNLRCNDGFGLGRKIVGCENAVPLGQLRSLRSIRTGQPLHGDGGRPF